MTFEHSFVILVEIGPRPPGSDGICQTQSYVSEQLKTSGCQVTEHDFHASMPIGDLPIKNTLVKIPNTGPGIVFGHPLRHRPSPEFCAVTRIVLKFLALQCDCCATCESPFASNSLALGARLTSSFAAIQVLLGLRFHVCPSDMLFALRRQILAPIQVSSLKAYCLVRSLNPVLVSGSSTNTCVYNGSKRSSGDFIRPLKTKPCLLRCSRADALSK